MHPACHHMFGASVGTPGSATLSSGFGPLGNGFGPLEMLGLLALAALGLGLILWMTRRQPAREDMAPWFAQERAWEGEPPPEVPFREWASPPAPMHTFYERTQVEYPEIPYEGPRMEQPWEQNPETFE